MDEAHPIRLSLLGHPLRWQVLALLVRRLPQGVSAGEIAQSLGVAPSTLSAHLAALTNAALLDLRSAGAARIYRARPGALGASLDSAVRDLCLDRAEAGTAPLPRPLRLLFLCDDNASLSLMAEALARRRLAGHALAGSAGVAPAAAADPLVLMLLGRRGHDLVALAPKAAAEQGAEIVLALTPRAAEALPACAGALCSYWPLKPADETDRVIPRAIALHAAYRALDTRLSALRRIDLRALPRHAVQAALDDLSSGLPAGGRACVSRPAHRQRSADRAPRASAAS